MATAEFLARFRSGSGRLARLAKIELPRADGSQIDQVYFGAFDTATPADSVTGYSARLWLGLIEDVGPIHMPGGFGSTDFAPCTGLLTLNAGTPVIFPEDSAAAITATLRESLALHVWTNARVTLYRFFMDDDDFKHAQIVLKDAAVTQWSLKNQSITLTLRQDMGWNRPLMPRIVTRGEFPRAPDSAVGLSLGIKYGDHSARRMRRPWPTQPDNFNYFNILDGTGPTQGAHARAILADTGRGSEATINPDAKVYVAGHRIKSVYDSAVGTGIWMDMEGQMGLVDSLSTVFNDDSGAGMTLPDDLSQTVIANIPQGFTAGTNYARDFHALFDPSDSSFAFFDIVQNLNKVTCEMGSMPTTVTPIDFKIVVGYQTSDDYAYLGLYLNTAGPTSGESFYVRQDWLPESTTPTIYVSGAIDWADLVNQTPPGNFSDFSQLRLHLRWDTNQSPAGQAKVFFMGLAVRCRPKLSLVQTARVIGSRVAPIPSGPGRLKFAPISVPFRQDVKIPAVVEMRSDFYANSLGIPDDNAGTYTGQADALIERAPDILTHALVNYGGIPLADIEAGAGVPGSFSDAHARLAESWGEPKHMLEVSESVDLLTALLGITADSLTQLLRSPYDNRFRLNVWRDDPAVDYPYTIGRYDIRESLGPIVELTPLQQVVTGVRVSYDYDGRDRAPRSEVSLSASGSIAGYDFYGLRDQNMVVVEGQNDRFDFRSTIGGGGLTERNASLTPGPYVPQSSRPRGEGPPYDYEEGFAQHLKSQMSWAEGTQASGSRYQVTWGTMVTAGHNDRLDFIHNGVNKTGTIPAGTYATCEALALAVRDAVNTAAGYAPPADPRFFCNYNRTTHKFYVFKSDGSNTWSIAGSSDYTSDRMQESGWAGLGFFHVSNLTIPQEEYDILYADDERLEEHFGITIIADSTFELAFQSGYYGADSAVSVRNCSDLLGFHPRHDRTRPFSPNGGRAYCGDCPKGDREHAMATAEQLYGPRRDVSCDCRTLTDTRSALALRNRIFDLFRAPRATIRFSTRALPDIERGHVIAFDTSLNTIAPYPAPGRDRSWAGKKFIVTEVVHNMGPDTLQTDVVAVDIGALPTNIVPVGAGVLMGNILWRLTE